MYQNQKSKRETIIFVIFLLIGLSFIIGRFTASVSLIKNFIYHIAYPNLNAANFIFRSVGNFADNLKAVTYLRQENIAYRQKNQELSDKLRNYELMSQEYKSLLNLLKLKSIPNTMSVFAKISVRDTSEWYQWLIIDKGSDDGLYNDLPVAMFNKDRNTLCAVGRIIETYKSSAKVVLITNPIYALPVEIKGKDINCLAEGFDSNLLKITHIAHGSDVNPGDELVVSELSSVFQKDMPVGIIKDVMDESSLDFKVATAEVFFEAHTLYDAVILVPKPETK
ncbi:MAG: rod shape-determining protein MreC [Endomicrobium sp.]|uniref:rod shape-determining protein MreC n=1 Tax=Candidatus Endomicrobiellum pyrsonymphae TaxID=1408203 RepID=UPI00357453C3|nr:rod shape-determining protein MreC [Endomicrobium sp.]